MVTIELDSPESLYQLDKAQDSVITLGVQDGRSVSPKQRKFAYALIGDISKAEIGGKWAGEPELIKRAFYFAMDMFYGVENFSLSKSKGNMSDANVFIDMLLDFCFKHNVPLSYRPLEWLDDPYIAKFEYACMMKKMCVICGKPAELAHIDNVKFTNSRKSMNHVGLRAMAFYLMTALYGRFVSVWSKR
ncbi:putative HNHc nuclease [Fructobacillus cardui]|uniref:putative HNHc nuclease n=1 Tax=Fructobacillus cardui TaxID=2893170 RepID=UPI0030C87CA6